NPLSAEFGALSAEFLQTPAGRLSIEREPVVPPPEPQRGRLSRQRKTGVRVGRWQGLISIEPKSGFVRPLTSGMMPHSGFLVFSARSRICTGQSRAESAARAACVV